MNTRVIKDVVAQEILDSRGEPTIRTTVFLDNGENGSAAVPAGASTGSHEARELRDGEDRYGGKGTLQAVKNVMTEILDAIRGQPVTQQQKIDRLIVERDGTPNRGRLGANAILSVSLACSRAAAIASRLPLYRYLQVCFRLPEPRTFPKPMCNVLNGGRHADNGVSFQEYLILPEGSSFAVQIERTWKVIRRLKEFLAEQGERTLVGDEGGFAPRLRTNEEGLALLARAVSGSGFSLGTDIKFGLDVAASEFQIPGEGRYALEPDHAVLSATELIDLYDALHRRYPLATLEDGLSEDAWADWATLTERLGTKVMIIGDDLFVTQKERLSQGIRARAANAILIKPNQVGTLSETMETIAVARDDGYQCVVSNRSGETSDDFIADLAVSTGSPYLKAGSLNRGERLAKYNRLLTIASEQGA